MLPGEPRSLVAAYLVQEIFLRIKRESPRLVATSEEDLEAEMDSIWWRMTPREQDSVDYIRRRQRSR